MSETKTPTAEVTLGGWSQWSFTATPAAEKIFQESLGALRGVEYKLIGFANQLVAGLNWVFLCEATPVVPSAENYIVEAIVFQPLEGQPIIRSIVDMGPDPYKSPGAWQSWSFTIPEGVEKIFDEGLGLSFGVSYTPLAYTSQFLGPDGIMYCFLCKTEATLAIQEEYPSRVYIQETPIGKPILRGIEGVPIV